MPPSANNGPEARSEGPPGQGLAVLAEALYLANLLLAPGLAFLALALLWRRHRDHAPALARQHLRQATLVSLYGGLLIVGLTALLLALGGIHWAGTWVLVILYFSCIHSTLVVFGVVALAKAMAGQPWRYPLIGPRLDGQP